MKTAIVHHGDADGCCSGALAALGVGQNYTLFSPASGGSRIEEELVQKLAGYDRVIVVDIGEKSKELMDRLAANSKLVWIDHHKDVEEIKGDFTYINPHLELSENKVPPASYLVYKYFQGERDMTPYVWIAAIGLLGDRAEKKFPEIFDKTFDIFPNLKGGPSFGEFAVLKKFVGLISSGRSYALGEGAVEAAELLVQAGKTRRPEMLLESELMDYMKNTSGMVREILEERKYEKHGRLVLCELNTKRYLQNYVAGRLRAMFPDKIIAVSNSGLYEKEMRLELRGNGIDLRELALKIAGDLGSTGGHRGAAGIRIPKEKWNILKERLIGELE